jgi:hypothetical protein
MYVRKEATRYMCGADGEMVGWNRALNEELGEGNKYVVKYI